MPLTKAGQRKLAQFIDSMDRLDSADVAIRKARKACIAVVQRCLMEDRAPSNVEMNGLQAFMNNVPTKEKLKAGMDFLAHDVADAIVTDLEADNIPPVPPGPVVE